jgi:lysophospholipase L1-like esterase
VRYVALGDSYTIGTSVAERDRWPNQLVAALRGNQPALDLVANRGVNGDATDDLIREELRALERLRPEFVSVLIGVNDVVQGVPVGAYASNVVTILDALLRLVPATRLVVVSVPDYTVTPAGGDFGDPGQQRCAIVEVNATMAALALARGIAFVDIFDISAAAGADRSLVADDGLHPSGAQYRRWLERILPVVRGLLEA